MKLVWKIVLIIAVILLILGIALLAVAMVTGGSVEGIRNNVALMDYEQSFAGQEIHTLELEFDAGTLKVLPGEELRVEAKNMIEREFYCVLDNGVLTVSDLWGDSWADSLSRFLTLQRQNAQITVYLPEGTQLRTAEIDISAGIADFRDVSAEQFVLDMSAGNVRFENLNTHYCEVDMSAGTLDIRGLQAAEVQLDTSAGDMEIEELNTAVLQLDSTAGSADISGTISDYCSVDISAGSVELYLTGSAEDYTAHLDRTAGSIRYDSHSYTGEARVGKGAGTMNLECSAGSIDVKFAG